MKVKKLPKGCRLNTESGDIECEDDAKDKLESEEQGSLFKNAPVEYESLHCDVDRRDGSLKCKARFKAEKKPTS